MSNKQKKNGRLPNGALNVNFDLPEPLADLFETMMKIDERESKAEFARLLIRRQLEMMKAKQRKV